ncbi:MAG TPA: glucans biosynthesis glucosyltransferase MdoH [Solimonas sp.]|nr:glucans biosynthesis glucosyltransferase MdoH [Solimonas sp.]
MDLRTRVDAYIDRLTLDPPQRAHLRERSAQLLAESDGAEAVFAELHRMLGAGMPLAAEAPAIQSVAARLHRAGPLVEDVQHRPRLATTPPLARASMAPLPWSRNPLSRLRAWLKLRLLGDRGHLASANPALRDEPPLRRAPWRTAGRNRRLLLLGLTLAQTCIATYFMVAILPFHGTHALELAMLAVYAILFAWISAGFWTALMGFWVLLRGHDKHAISGAAPGERPLPPEARTAILVPICNEDVVRVFAGIRATYDSIAREGVREQFDFYILSDTSHPDVRVAEQEAWLRLCREVHGFGHVYYRRRTHRIKRKSGNIADWCRRWGSGYRYMVILDADSVMSGACLKRLVQLMEASPTAGIIQTAPRASGRETLYARIQQFATRVYGPLFTAGLHFWQLGESHYWGHNAIIRVAPFMRHCALGKLPGRGALAGEIMSHDFVEAALMRRAGWAVWIAYDLPGSYEEMPPALLDELRRDQRWCQGNLQNFRLFLTQGLHPAHRAVFMTGVMAYLSAPLWFLFLVLSTSLLAVSTLTEPQYFTQPYQLFPTWPEWHPEWALRLFGGTMTLLFLPKLLGALLLVLRPQQLRLYGGVLRLGDGLLLEMLFSALLAPIRMLFHTRYVLTALAGFAVQWKSPPREDAATPWPEAIRRHGLGTLLGLGWAGLVSWLNPHFLWWLLPVAGSLVIAIPLSVWSSRAGLGRWFRERRIFLIPEEANPPRELRWLRAGLRRARGPGPGFAEAVADPAVNALVCAAGHPRPQLPRQLREDRNQAADRAIQHGPDVLSDAQRNVLLSDPIALSRMHLQLWAADAPSPQWPRERLRQRLEPSG